MTTDKKSLIYKFIFGIILIYIVVMSVLLYTGTNEDFSFKKGEYTDFGEDWYCENTGESINCPYTVAGIDKGEILIISKRLPENMNMANCLAFRCFQCSCEVYVDDVLRESYDDIQYRGVSKFPASASILVELYPEDSGKLIKIIYKCDNRNFLGSVSNIYFGQKEGIIRHIIDKYSHILILAVFMIVFGFICILLYYVLFRSPGKNKSIVYLGVFLITMGAWIIVSSRMRQMLFGNITAIQYLELWLVSFLPVPVVFFCDIRCDGRYRKLSHIVLTICYVEFITVNTLHFTGICDKAYTMIAGHFCCIIVAVYLVLCYVMEYRAGYKKETLQMVFAFVFLMVFTLIDISLLYINRQWEVGSFISFGTIIFALLILIYSTNDFIAEANIKTALIAESAAKDQFFATMSHDIRTPINAIIGMNEMIQRESNEKMTLEYSGDIERASETLLSIVNNILDFSKIREGKYDLIEEKFNFSTAIADVIKMTSPIAENKGLEFITNIDKNIPKVLVGDENALKRILTNLLSNAVKYTKEGHVEFCAELVENRTKNDEYTTVKFIVCDTGIGIMKKDIPHIFDVFSRMDGEKNKNVQGTGLGLAITNALATSMGSKINVSSVYGEGSEFSFAVDFPVFDNSPIGDFSIEASNIEIDKEEEIEKENVQTFYDPSKTVLIVDDTSMNIKVMKKLLQLNGVKVETASSGEECIQCVSQNHFDIILLDDMMPGMDGRETLKHLKESGFSTFEGVPVIALTANAGPGARDKYISLGFDDYMSKPVNPDSLNDMLFRYLS